MKFKGNPLHTMFRTSKYGFRNDPINGKRSFHSGNDYRGNTSTPVLAVDDGVVIATGDYNDNLGIKIIIEHATGLRSHYAHLSQSTVRAGQEVKVGQTIGYVGSTGRSTGNHLHFGVDTKERRGTYLDPDLYLPKEDIVDLVKENEKLKSKLERIHKIIDEK